MKNQQPITDNEIHAELSNKTFKIEVVRVSVRLVLSLCRHPTVTSQLIPISPRPPAAVSHLEVQDGEAVPVRPADNGVEVLKLGGQECSEGSLQAHGPGLLEAQEVCSADSSHVPGLRGVQGDEMQLLKTGLC